MKILLVDLEKEWRGGQNQALLILKAVNARGDTAELVTVKGSALGKRAGARRITVHSVPRHAARLFAALKIFQLTSHHLFDVVHANEAHAVTAAWLARAHRRAAFVISRRVGYPLGKRRLALARYHAAARIVAISKWVAERLVESGAPKDKIVVVYEGVDVSKLLTSEVRRQRARARWNLADTTPLLGSVGALLPDKGHELLIRALAQLRQEFPDCRLLIAGVGPSKAALEALVKELGLQEAVIFAGFVADIEMVYQALDVFLFPSFFEGLGTSLLAAMSYEVPSITFQCCAFEEIIENEKTGLLVKTGDLSQIVEAATRLLRDKEFARAIGVAGRQRVAEVFSSERMVGEMTRVYREVGAR